MIQIRKTPAVIKFSNRITAGVLIKRVNTNEWFFLEKGTLRQLGETELLILRDFILKGFIIAEKQTYAKIAKIREPILSHKLTRNGSKFTKVMLDKK